MGLRTLDDIRPLYFLPDDPFPEEVLIPGFQIAEQVDCMVGFFSSAVLASLAPGLATYINSSSNNLRLIISPLVTPEDLAAIETGVKSREGIATEILESLIITVDALKLHTLKCLSFLLRSGRIEIKIAIMRGALFHPKVWLFHSGEDLMVADGSSNATNAGIRKNIEHMTISMSWESPKERYVAEKFSGNFERLWNNNDANCDVISLPDAVRQELLRTYSPERTPTEQDYFDLVVEKNATDVVFEIGDAHINRVFAIPPHLRYDEGPYDHQGKAVSAWCQAGHNGVLEMATGSGKTITAMIGAFRLYETIQPLLIVVAAPYKPLIEQWCEEIRPFGLEPIDLTAFSGAQKRGAELQKIRRRLRTGVSRVEVVVVSHVTLCTSAFHEAISAFECDRMLIADEVHNLGSPEFLENLPEFFNYRLGLSATPIRQYDEEGTDALFSFFGPIVFRFSLEDAIGRCLVEYEYYVHPVYLTALEMEKWYEITDTIKRNAWRSDNGSPDKFLSKLLRDRRVLLEMAESKLATLDALLADEDMSSLKHTLIYTTDKGPRQLKSVNKMLEAHGVLYHQLTSEETSDRLRTKQILRSFQNGEIQILTAKRVLDEGVNIPQIRKAFILASTTVERQWVQRRGRLLRTCDEIGKRYSVIHDFLVLPPDLESGLDPDARTLVKSELLRAQEFARLSMNAGRPDGPMLVLDKLIRSTLS